MSKFSNQNYDGPLLKVKNFNLKLKNLSLNYLRANFQNFSCISTYLFNYLNIISPYWSNSINISHSICIHDDNFFVNFLFLIQFHIEWILPNLERSIYELKESVCGSTKKVFSYIFPKLFFCINFPINLATLNVHFFMFVLYLDDEHRSHLTFNVVMTHVERNCQSKVQKLKIQ